jgi:hypothetical protein
MPAIVLFQHHGHAVALVLDMKAILLVQHHREAVARSPSTGSPAPTPCWTPCLSRNTRTPPCSRNTGWSPLSRRPRYVGCRTRHHHRNATPLALHGAAARSTTPGQSLLHCAHSLAGRRHGDRRPHHEHR